MASAAGEGKLSGAVASKLGENLHLRAGHPLNIVKETIEQHFTSLDNSAFVCYDQLDPEVTVQANFDDLLIPKDHVSRSPTDTFYIGDDKVLRTHTSAHQVELMRQGNRAFLCTGDVYRRDTVDRTHYPVFHQTEGLRIFEQWGDGEHASKKVEADMKETLDGLVRALFGDVEMRWNPDYFPFTDPSWELEIRFNGEWTEVLGCGVVRQEILSTCGYGHARAWAFGLGLERLAMILFNVPDIRLFWSRDSRFHEQVLLCTASNYSLPGEDSTCHVPCCLSFSSKEQNQDCTHRSHNSFHTANTQSATKTCRSGLCVHT